MAPNNGGPTRRGSSPGVWEALKPGASEEVKRRAGLSAETDYTTDLRCLACHAVGVEQLGGYRVPDPTDGKSGRFAAARRGVGCEACHGPGSDFVQIMSDIYKNQRTYDPEELHVAGRRTVTAETCRACHRAEAPCFTVDRDDTNVGTEIADSVSPRLRAIDIADRRSYHQRVPLLLRRPPR